MNKTIGLQGQGTGRVNKIDELGRDMAGVPEGVHTEQEINEGLPVKLPNQNTILNLLRSRMQGGLPDHSQEVAPEVEDVSVAPEAEQMQDSEFEGIRPRLMELAKMRMTKGQV